MALGWTSSARSPAGSYGYRNAAPAPAKAPAASSGSMSNGMQSTPVGSGPSTPMKATQVSSTAAAPDYSALIAQLTKQNSQPVQAPAPLVNVSTPNPTVDQTVIPALLNRAQGGMGADTAIRLAQGSTRDMLSGTLKELEQGAARRGVGGTGAEGLQKGRAATKAQQQMAGQASQIAYGAEQDRNKLLQDTAGLALQSDQAQNEQRRIGLSQWQAQQQVGLEQQRINQAKDDRLLNILTQALF